MDTKSLSRALRHTLREKGWSQARFAAGLGISLPTAKRWLRGEGISLEDWLRALEMINLSLHDLLERSGADTNRQFTYTPEQEIALANTPGLLPYFDHLLGGRSPAALGREFRLGKAQTADFLSKLAKLGLVEWLPRDRVKLLVSGEPRWQAGGPLARKFRRLSLKEFTDQFGDDPEALRIGLYELTDDSLAAIPALYAELLEKLRQREVVDARRSGRRKKITVLLGAAPFTPSMLSLSAR